MEKMPIYTIGHGARKSEDFLKVLTAFGVKYLIDVRSQPYSKFHPQFRQDELRLFLEQNDIKYVWMGDTLGGRPTDKTCYDSDGKIDYEKVKTRDFFKAGIGRLKVAYNKNLPIALMCSEGKPSECHRTKLIGRVLSAENILLMHIDEKGKLRTQAEVIDSTPPSFGL
jgi:uncharacterized protein (DUF488 family)